MALTTHPHLVLMLKSRAVPLLPLCAFMAGYRFNFVFANDQCVSCTIYSVLKGSVLVGTKLSGNLLPPIL